MNTIRAVLLSLLLVASAFAGIGQSPASIEKKIGAKPVRRDALEGSDMRFYNNGTYSYIVVFVQGRSVMEVFSRLDKKPIDPSIINGWLSGYVADHGQWKACGTSRDGRTGALCTTDGRLKAVYGHVLKNAGEHVFTISDMQWAKYGTPMRAR